MTTVRATGAAMNAIRATTQRQGPVALVVLDRTSEPRCIPASAVPPNLHLELVGMVLGTPVYLSGQLVAGRSADVVVVDVASGPPASGGFSAGLDEHFSVLVRTPRPASADAA